MKELETIHIQKMLIEEESICSWPDFICQVFHVVTYWIFITANIFFHFTAKKTDAHRCWTLRWHGEERIHNPMYIPMLTSLNYAFFQQEKISTQGFGGRMTTGVISLESVLWPGWKGKIGNRRKQNGSCEDMTLSDRNEKSRLILSCEDLPFA